MFTNFIEQLIFELKKTLPGKEAQNKMAPRFLKEISTFNHYETPLKSSVLILFYPKNNDIYTVFIKRAIDGKTHSGQIAFAGGKFNPEDQNLKQTALREAEEEIGIFANDVKLIGTLTNHYIPISNIIITPVVGYLDYEPFFIPNKSEVQDIIEIPIKELMANHNKGVEILSVHGYEIEAPFFNAHSNHIWGATAMILSELFEISGKLI